MVVMIGQEIVKIMRYNQNSKSKKRHSQISKSVKEQ